MCPATSCRKKLMWSFGGGPYKRELCGLGLGLPHRRLRPLRLRPTWRREVGSVRDQREWPNPAVSTSRPSLWLRTRAARSGARGWSQCQRCRSTDPNGGAPGRQQKKHAAAVRGGAVFAIAIVIRSRETFPNGAARKGETLTARAIPAVGLGGGEARIGGAAAT